MKTPLIFLFIVITFTSCYVHQWNDAADNLTLDLPTDEVSNLFQRANDTLYMSAQCPGYNYQFDVGEKHDQYGVNSSQYHFNKVMMTLCDSMPGNMVLVNIEISDSSNNKFRFEKVDLLRFIPTIDARDSLMYPEYLLEEFNRWNYFSKRAPGI
ncbi:MAG: hypothetical protein JKY54_03675 [Flavobacteriales bacterium]|nr:hypothetical protein [Flavobacteriales bacterium]